MLTPFDNLISRHNTNSLKFDTAVKRGKPQDATPMWVADMDFAAPQCVLDALKTTASHGIFGYAEQDDNYYKILSNWLKKRHSVDIKQEWVLQAPGVVFALNVALRAFTDEQDAVLIQTPVYYPFYSTIKLNNRKLVTNPLIYNKTTNSYKIDFVDLENKIKENKVKLFILCSPHNPVGRVWSQEELNKMGELCLKHNVKIIADEIWADLVFTPNKHTSFYTLNQNLIDNSIVLFSPSKTFNLAGLQYSDVFIANTNLKNKFQNEYHRTGYEQLNTMGIVAAKAAYASGGEWLNNLLIYLKQNRYLIANFLNQNQKNINMVNCEASYLAWLDFKQLNLPQDKLDDLLLKKAKLWLSSGTIFGTEGQGYFRLNFATQRAVLEDALFRLQKTFC